MPPSVPPAASVFKKRGYTRQSISKLIICYSANYPDDNDSLLRYGHVMSSIDDSPRPLHSPSPPRPSRIYSVLRIILPLLVFVALVSLVIFVTGGSKYFMNSGRADHQDIIAPGIGGPFSLVNQDGVAVTEKNYADHYKLTYFGFTYCPVICPTSLSKMVEAYLALPPNLRAKLQIIFITLDPERDTAPVVKSYVGLFDPHLVGLTGSMEQIEDVKKAYKVFATKVGEGDNYTIDHSSFIYLQNPEGKTIGLFKTSDNVDMIRGRLEQVLSQAP